MAMNVKKGDTVVVLSGKDKGKQGKVQRTIPKEDKVVVEGINMVTCQGPPPGGGEHHRPARGRSVRLQGPGGLPQVRQGHPGRPQDRGR